MTDDKKGELGHEKFVEILTDIVDESGGVELLMIPGVYEAVSEHYNNDVIDRWRETADGDDGECSDCEGRGWLVKNVPFPSGKVEQVVVRCQRCETIESNKEATETYAETELLPWYDKYRELRAKSKTNKLGYTEARKEMARIEDEEMTPRLVILRASRKRLREIEDAKPRFEMNGGVFTDLQSGLATLDIWRCPGCGGGTDKIVSILSGGVHCGCGKVTL